MRGLYAIADATTLLARGIDPLAFAAAVLETRPVALQLRAKDMTSGDTADLLRRLLPLCRRAGVPLFANDLPEVARLAGCDGVHVGQKDATVEAARRAAPGLLVGVSTHTIAELDVALSARPTYVAFGPVFPTSSKAAPEPVVGLEGLRAARLRSLAAGIPLVAIGGITHTTAPGLVGLADAVAVIGALVPPPTASNSAQAAPVLDQVTARARALRAMFDAPGGSADKPIATGTAR